MGKRRYCGARKKQGPGTCRRPAGWGTPYKTGRCKLHGGATRTHRQKAAREAAAEAVATYGLPRELDPHEALLEEVYRTAGHVAWLGQVVAGLEREQLVEGVTKQSRTVPLPGREGSDRPDGDEGKQADVNAGSERTEIATAISVWVRLYQQERDRLVRVAKAALDAGVAERQVQIAEQQATLFAAAIRAIVIDLGIDPASKPARAAFRKHLTLIQGGKAA